MQPIGLVAWPQHDGVPLPCWKVTAIHDSDLGWPGQCDGLEKKVEVDAQSCGESCANDPMCQVWEFTAQSECYQGEGLHCQTSTGQLASVIRRAQRLQHGAVRVLKDMKGWEVFNLRSLGSWNTGNESDGIEHCRAFCYSDISCQYWQYGEGGCFVEDPRDEMMGLFRSYVAQYPLTTDGGATRDSPFAQSALAGEYIQHICPAHERAAANSGAGASSSNFVSLWLPWCLVAVVLLISVAVMALLCYRRGGSPACGSSDSESGEDVQRARKRAVKEQLRPGPLERGVAQPLIPVRPGSGYTPLTTVSLPGSRVPSNAPGTLSFATTASDFSERLRPQP